MEGAELAECRQTCLGQKLVGMEDWGKAFPFLTCVCVGEPVRCWWHIGHQGEFSCGRCFTVRPVGAGHHLQRCRLSGAGHRRASKTEFSELTVQKND